MSRQDKRALLAELAQALVPGSLQPSLEQVQRVRDRAEAGMPLVDLERRRHRLQRIIVVLAVLVCILAFLAGVVLAPSLPSPVRAALESVGLTLESP